MKYFEQLDSHTLCRMGGNGPLHKSQLYAINKYVKDGDSLLDVGCGSATTLEAIQDYTDLKIDYKGVDFIEKHIEWCKKQYPNFNFAVEDALNLLEKDQSFDIVYSRHVVDHLRGFSPAVKEFARVAKKYIIIILFIPFYQDENYSIENIFEGDKFYEDEYRNKYSKLKALRFIEREMKQWELIELAENIGEGPINKDTIIVLRRKND